MSGGSHNYVCFKIEEELCGRMWDPELDDLMQDIANLAHDLEWYESGDYGRDDYFKSVKAFKEKWFEGDRKTRLKGYIDEKLEQTREELYSMIGSE